MVATAFSREKAKWLNILHAGWPAGLALGALFTVILKDMSWEWKFGAMNQQQLRQLKSLRAENVVASTVDCCSVGGTVTSSIGWLVGAVVASTVTNDVGRSVGKAVGSGTSLPDAAILNGVSETSTSLAFDSYL